MEFYTQLDDGMSIFSFRRQGSGPKQRNRYGFHTEEIDGYMTDDAGPHICALFHNLVRCRVMLDPNFVSGKKYISYEVLHKKPMTLMVEQGRPATGTHPFTARLMLNLFHAF